MTGFLLDTNVLSEAGKPSPAASVCSFLVGNADLLISVISIHEIEYGVGLLPPSRRRADLESRMAMVISTFGARILPVGEPEAKRAAHLRAEARRLGRTLHLPDALIAATAKERGLTMATRNVADFEHLGVDVIDPWAA
jgi:predicted nucleic acid-binding protein